MTVSSLPTDNLYKFLALFGLVIALASFGLLETRHYQLSVLETKLETEVNSLKHGLRNTEEWQVAWERYWKDLTGEEWNGDWYRSADNIEKSLAELRARIPTKNDEASQGKGEAPPRMEELEKINRVIRHGSVAPTRGDFEKAFQSIMSAMRLLVPERQRFALLSEILVPSGFLGIIISLLGFWLWYQRFQRYQDQLVRLQSEAAQHRAKANGQSINADDDTTAI